MHPVHLMFSLSTLNLLFVRFWWVVFVRRSVGWSCRVMSWHVHRPSAEEKKRRTRREGTERVADSR